MTLRANGLINIVLEGENFLYNKLLQEYITAPLKIINHLQKVLFYAAVNQNIEL